MPTRSPGSRGIITLLLGLLFLLGAARTARAETGFPDAMVHILKPGDLLFDKIGSSKVFDHTQIVVGFNHNEVMVAQHSEPKVESITREIAEYHAEHKGLSIDYVRVDFTKSKNLEE